MTKFKHGDAIEFTDTDEVGGRDVFPGQRATYDDRDDYTGSVPYVRLPDGHRGAAYSDRFKLVSEVSETEEVSIHSTHDLQAGDVVVSPETDDAYPQVRRAKAAPRLNALPTAEGSVVKFKAWRHAVLVAKHGAYPALEWTFVTGSPVTSAFDPFTTDIEFEVKYDAGKASD